METVYRRKEFSILIHGNVVEGWENSVPISGKESQITVSQILKSVCAYQWDRQKFQESGCPVHVSPAFQILTSHYWKEWAQSLGNQRMKHLHIFMKDLKINY